MSQETKRTTTRRAVLYGAAPAVAAIALTGGTALAAVTPDPAIAAATEYKAAWRAHTAAVNATYDTAEAREQAISKTNDAIWEALEPLFDVTPTTVTGAAALLAALAYYQRDGQAREYSALEWWVNRGDNNGAAVNDVLLEIAAVLQNGGRP
jgi:hypothetical protein